MASNCKQRIQLSGLAFCADALCECIEELGQPYPSALESIRSKAHIKYISKYLGEIQTKTIIVERPYIDKDFLHDYWAFWSDGVSIEEYRCVRLHFFDKEYRFKAPKIKMSKVEWEDLHEFLMPKPDASKSYGNVSESHGNYLGFIVLFMTKNKMIVGRTCLKTYPSEDSTNLPKDEDRNSCMIIPTLRKYPVNLVGHELSLNSLAFREQDGVTSACATCSLWFTFQKTSKMYAHEILSPGEITGRALNIRHRGSLFPPMKGLSPHEMLLAIRSIPDVQAFHFDRIDIHKEYSPAKEDIWRMALFDFVIPLLNHGIPIILILKSDKEDIHAVSVVGYKCKWNDSCNHSTRNIENMSCDGDVEDTYEHRYITSLIAHDDNIGPFVNYEIDSDGNIQAGLPWAENGHKYKIINAINVTHNSMKVYPIEGIQSTLELYNDMLEDIHTKAYPDDLDRLFLVRSWSFKIWLSNEYKKELMKINGSAKLMNYVRKLLLQNLPEYVMIVSKRGGGFDHDMIFSLAGPWEEGELIQIVPREELAIDFFKGICNGILNNIGGSWIEKEMVGPVADYIASAFR